MPDRLRVADRSARGVVPADGPQEWTSGTLFPMSSKKTRPRDQRREREPSACGAREPVGLRRLTGIDAAQQLEYGAEIGRAITNFDGPIVFCVVSRFHGGAFVVFSKPLNERIEIAAVEGSYASVIGGAPAAAVVFARTVDDRTAARPRWSRVRNGGRGADDERRRVQTQLTRSRPLVHSQKLGESPTSSTSVHTIERAQRVGFGRPDHPRRPDLRPYVVDALERGMARDLGGHPPAVAGHEHRHRPGECQRVALLVARRGRRRRPTTTGWPHRERTC